MEAKERHQAGLEISEKHTVLVEAIAVRTVGVVVMKALGVLAGPHRSHQGYIAVVFGAVESGALAENPLI